MTDKPVSVNYLKYWPGNKLRSPFEYINIDQNELLKKDCSLSQISLFVECTCDGIIPKTIKVDVGNAKKKEVIRLSSLRLPEGVRPAHSVSSDLVVAVMNDL